jgi:protein-disulfide isomerase
MNTKLINIGEKISALFQKISLRVRLLLISLGVILLVGLMIGVIFPSVFSNMLTSTNTMAGKADSITIKEIRPNPQIGPKDAPVTIVEFGDFACPACREWAQNGMREQLLNKYKGQLRFVWADFPVITLDSPKAAEAGRCAYDQDKFWEYQDYLYINYKGADNASLKSYATAVGLNRWLFDLCLDSGAKKDEVDLDFLDAMNRFLSNTPTFLINDRVRVIGLTSIEAFSTYIDPILAGKSS